MELDYPKNLRISTSTATCNINSLINLNIIYNKLEIDENIIYIEYANEISKGKNPGKKKSKKASDKKKLFYNQITIIVKPYEDKEIFNNVKLFNNGAISMTGLKRQEGEISIRIIIEKVKEMKGNILVNQTKETICSLCGNETSVYNIKQLKFSHVICKICIKKEPTSCNICNTNLIDNAIVNNEICKIKDYKIVLINSDYYIGFDINREKLHEILYNKYQIYTSYEPCIYPGVNSKYYWNEDYMDNELKGKCYCSKFCNGKGTGKGNGNCKKITISIFQSGSIIITGARDYRQIKTAYYFINGIILDNIDIVKKNVNKLFQQNTKKKIVKLNKCNIKNYPDEETEKKITSILSYCLNN